MVNKQSFSIKNASNGKGLFSRRQFKANQTLFEIQGKLVHYTELLRRGGDFQNNTLRYDKDYYLNPKGHLGYFLNHSCEPNSRVDKIKGKLYLIATKPIKQGQEVVLDYSTNLARDDVWTMVCRCGSKTCRKKIKNYTSLPPKLLAYYKKSGIIPKYILEIK